MSRIQLPPETALPTSTSRRDEDQEPEPPYIIRRISDEYIRIDSPQASPSANKAGISKAPSLHGARRAKYSPSFGSDYSNRPRLPSPVNENSVV